jgi:cytochrome c-type biogenesis protein CcmE
MKTKTIKIAATSAAIVLALTGLMYTTLSGGAEYYKHVDEVMADPEAWYGKKLQLHGYVVEGSIQKRPQSLDYRFEVQSNGKVVRATYTGVVPDTFKDSSEVVIKGELSEHGFAVAPNGVMAKCPSKYEPAGVAATTGAGR